MHGTDNQRAIVHYPGICNIIIYLSMERITLTLLRHLCLYRSDMETPTCVPFTQMGT